MTLNTRIADRFEYHLEDLTCVYCLFYIGKRQHRENGCGSDICHYEDIHADAVANGRLKRKRRWFNAGC